MHGYQISCSHCWLHWVHRRHIHWCRGVMCGQELIGMCGLYWHLRGILVFVMSMAKTWCWWCHPWHYCICWDDCLEVLYYLSAGASTSIGISAMFHWQCHWCHVIPIPMTSHDQKRHVASQFYCLDLRNALVPLMTLLTSCDNIAGTSVVTFLLTKKVMLHLFQSSWHKEGDDATDDTMGIK